jgi:hypothetical protein
MIDKVFKPEDWGIADKNEWVVADRLLFGEATMPALEGRDVVGFVESIDFAAGQFIPDNVKKMAAGQPNYTFTNPQTRQTYTKVKGHWTVSGQDAKEVQNRMSRAIDRGNVPKERVDEPKAQSKTTSKPKPKQEPKPVSKPEPAPVEKKKESVSPQPSQGQRNSDGSIRNGDIEIATPESLQRVSELASTPSSDKRFEAGRNNQVQFKEHFGADSKYRPGLDNLNRVAKDPKRVASFLEAASSGNLNETIKLAAKESYSVGDLLKEAGVNINNKEELDSFVKAYKTVNGFIKPDGDWKTGETHELTGSNLGYFEAQHISLRSDLLSENPAGLQAKAFNFSSENQSELSNLDPRTTEALFNLLPTSAKVQLSKSGSPKTFYDPRFEGQQGKNPNGIRGAAVLHMWAMQDGVSAYSASGQRRSPGEFQVEHIVPLKAGGSDHIDNFAMITRRENEPRADLPFAKFLEQAKRKTQDVKADLNNPETRAGFEERYRAASFNAEIAPVIGGSVSGLIDDSVVSNVNAGLTKGLGEEGAQNLGFTSENWNKYKTEFTSFLDKNGINPDASLQDLSADQINGAFEIMKENLGVEKEKMVEYLGRALFNNYDLGVRHVINKKTGVIEEGRGGTAPTPGSLLNMQNLIVAESSGMTPEQTATIIQTVKDLHQNLKKTRTELIRNPNNPEAYENYVSSIVENTRYLTGVGDNSPFDHRQYDTRLTASNRNNIHSDTASTIMSLLSLDTASVTGGKDVMSPGSQKTLTEKTRQNITTLSNFLLSSYVKTSGLTPEQIKNPDTLTKTKRKPIEPLIAALENMNRGLNS